MACGVAAVGLWLLSAPGWAQAPATAKKAAAPAAQPKASGISKPVPYEIKPTLADVPYGSHPRQVIDFWKAKADRPTPLFLYIHGGGWNGGDKSRVTGVGEYLAAGISVASINYRLVPQAQEAGAKPPVDWPLKDAARALQFIRSKADEWNIDKARIGASGGSAGACSSLWLAFHDDMADPRSDDPVARQSTRLWCVGVSGPQTTLDPKQMREWIQNSRYGGHAFGFRGFDEFYNGREQIASWIKEYSPFEWAGAGDPPVCMVFKAAPAPAGQDEKDPTHSAWFGVKLQEKLRSVGVESYVIYPGAPETKYKTIPEFMIDKLKAASARH